MEKNQVQLLADLEKLVEENQFVAHAYSILETEEITDKVGIKNYSSGFYNSWLLGLLDLQNFTKIENFRRQIFEILSILSLIGSAVFTFIEYKKKNEKMQNEKKS